MRISDWSSDVCSSDLPDHGGKHPFYITSFDAFTRADHSRNLPSASAAYGGNARDGELPPLCNVVCGGSPWGGQRYGRVLAPHRRAPPGDRPAGRRASLVAPTSALATWDGGTRIFSLPPVPTLPRAETCRTSL